MTTGIDVCRAQVRPTYMEAISWAATALLERLKDPSVAAAAAAGSAPSTPERLRPSGGSRWRSQSSESELGG